MLRVFTCIFMGVLFQTSVYAGAHGTGSVSLFGGSGSIVYFGITPAPVNKAVCNTNTDYQYTIDISTDTGKAMYSALLTAMSAGKQIRVMGTGQCLLHSQMEDVSYWIVWP